MPRRVRALFGKQARCVPCDDQPGPASGTGVAGSRSGRTRAAPGLLPLPPTVRRRLGYIVVRSPTKAMDGSTHNVEAARAGCGRSAPEWTVR